MVGGKDLLLCASGGDMEQAAFSSRKDFLGGFIGAML
jgi:hypothetical protein